MVMKDERRREAMRRKGMRGDVRREGEGHKDHINYLWAYSHG